MLKLIIGKSNAGRSSTRAGLGFKIGLTCALLLSSASVHADTEVILKLAHVGSTPSAFSAGAKAFADSLNTLTKGRYKVEEFSGSALGNEAQIIDAVKAGTIDIVITGLAGPAPAMVPELGVIVIPNLFSGPEHARQVLDGPIGQSILDAMTARGVIGLGLGDNGFRQVLLTNKVVKTPADLAGLKIRIPKSPTLEKVFKSWGADPVAMNVDDVYKALETGRIDGMENAIPNAASYRFFDHIKHVVMNNYSYSSLVFMASPDTYAEMSDADKKAIKEAGRAGAQATRDYVASEEKRLIVELKSKGVNFITDFDKQAFSDAVKPVQDEIGAKYGDIYKQIISLK